MPYCINTKDRRFCVVCGWYMDEVLSFPEFPLTDVFVDEYREGVYVDQSFCMCENCGHGQLSTIIHPNVLYNEYNYSFRASRGGANDKFFQFLDDVHSDRFESIIEVGCNDCYLLNKLRDKADYLIGIDPVLKGHEDEYNDDKLKVYGDFIENVIVGKHKNSLYLSSHVIEHLDDPRGMLEKLVDSSSDDCLFIFQFPSLDYLVFDHRFDQVYNHHLHYFSLYSFKTLLDSVGCSIIAYDYLPNYWGTLMVAFSKDKATGCSVDSTQINIDDLKSSYVDFILSMDLFREYALSACKNTKMFCYGATLQFPMLMYYNDGLIPHIDSIVDEDRNKSGKYYLGIDVGIKHLDDVSMKDSIVLLSAHNFARSIIPKLLHHEPKKIILPFNII